MLEVGAGVAIVSEENGVVEAVILGVLFEEYFLVVDRVGLALALVLL